MLTAPLRVLVTRPKHQSEALSHALLAKHFVPVLAPTIEICDPPDKKSFLEAIKKLDKMDWAIFFSPNAVIKSVSFIRAMWPILPSALKIAAIGESTAQALTTSGFQVEVYPEAHFNSEGLLACKELQRINHQHIILFQGQGGRGTVAPILRARGARITLAIAYERKCPNTDLTPFITPSLDAVISTSLEGLRHLIDLVNPEKHPILYQLPLFVISERMLRSAYELGFLNCYLARNASNDAIVEALLFWKEKRHEHGYT